MQKELEGQVKEVRISRCMLGGGRVHIPVERDRWFRFIVTDFDPAVTIPGIPRKALEFFNFFRLSPSIFRAGETMPVKRVPTRRITEVLQLKLEAKPSHEKIGHAVLPRVEGG